MMGTKTCNYINLASFSDVHLAHPKTPTGHILGVLRHYFPDCHATAELDIIFIPGDFFDRRLELPEEQVYEIRRFITGFLRLCKKHDIVLRVLEGTPSHDWRQSKLFTHLNEINEIEADVRYVDVLSIEYIERLDLQVLYIPDEWRATTREVWSDVQAKLHEHQLSKVDIVIMHGAFPHQMPEHLHNRLQLHDPNAFLSICNYVIIVGHIHFFSQYERILASGSLDRLHHGEEAPKGHLRIRIDRLHGQHVIQFIENEYAVLYKTYDCTGLDEHGVNDLLEAALARLPKDSHVRIKCKRGDAVVAMLPHYINRYPSIDWSIKETGRNTETDSTDVIDKVSTRAKGTQINAGNIAQLLIGRIELKHPALAQRCQRLLLEVLNE